MESLTIVLVNSEKGRELFSRTAPRLVYYKKSAEEALEKNPLYLQSAILNPDSEKFLSQLGERTFAELMEQYFTYLQNN